MEPADVMEKKLAEMKVIQEIISTEQTYNESLDLLAKAFSYDDEQVKQNPTLLQLQTLITQLKDISDRLLANIIPALSQGIDDADRLKLKIQRTQLLKLFFVAYQGYPVLFEAYHSQCPENPRLFEGLEKFIRRESTKKFKLADYLIEPFQRGPRYKLLVSEALKRSEVLPQRNIDELVELEAFITKAISDVNARMKAVDSAPSYQFVDISRWVINSFWSAPKDKDVVLDSVASTSMQPGAAAD